MLSILFHQRSTLPGVAQVNIFGIRRYAVRIRVNPGERQCIAQYQL